MTNKISIDPITRLEGHGKIEIFLDERGDVENAFWQVTELRGFEKFCLGRPAEEMTRIVPNICGVCPSAHHMAATKALDKLFGVEPTYTAKLIRQFEFNAFIVEDHYIHFFFLAAPDFVMGPDAPPKERNVLGLIERLGKDIGLKVIEIRKRNRRIIQHLFSKPAHPEGGLPGGVPKGLSEEDRSWLRETVEVTLDFAKYAVDLFKELVLKNQEYLKLIKSEAYTLKTNYMALVDENNRVSFYDGKLKVVDTKGNQIAYFDPSDYLEHISEHVLPWSYVKFPYLKKIGWTGLNGGDGTSLYRVGPLARINVADGMATPLAQKEYEEMLDVLGGKPVHNTLAMHWARLICALQAAESNRLILNDPHLTSKDIRDMNLRLRREGIGCVEAPRGVLIHHYKTDEEGLLSMVNLLVATQHNAGAICASVREAARAFIKKGEIREGLLNRVEMAFRAYDPCLACATHSLPGRIPLCIEIRDKDGKLVRTLRNF